MASALPLTVVSLIITTFIVRFMPSATFTKIFCVFVIVLALSAAAATYLTTSQEERKETKEERKRRKKRMQKELMKKFFPKKVESMGRRRAPKVEIAEDRIGGYPVE